MKKNTANTITATINGVVFSGLTIGQAQVLAAMATNTNTEKANVKTKAEAKAEKHATAKAKAEKIRATHDTILDSKRVERMTETAIKKLNDAGFEVKASKQGAWMWVYPCGKSNGKGRTDEFKSVKLPKGWKHSMKRGGFFRDFSEAK